MMMHTWVEFVFFIFPLFLFENKEN